MTNTSPNRFTFSLLMAAITVAPAVSVLLIGMVSL